MAIRKSPDSNYPGSKVSTHECLRGIITFFFVLLVSMFFFFFFFCVLHLQLKFIRGTCINCKFCLLIGLISSHSPTILNNLHKSISRRLSEISNYKETFEQATDIYNSALEASGYNEGLEYINQEVRDGRARNKRKRERQIIWYKPPFSKSVTTNIA